MKFDENQEMFGYIAIAEMKTPGIAPGVMSYLPIFFISRSFGPSVLISSS